jgi:hypothetical protein
MIRIGRRRALPPVLAAAALVLVESPLHAEVVRWDGGAGTDNWADARNWSTDALPADTDDIDFFEPPERGFLDLHLGADRTIRNIVAPHDWSFEAKRMTIGSVADVAAGRALTLSGGRLEVFGTVGRVTVNIELVLGGHGRIDVSAPTTITGVIRDGGAGYGLHATERLSLSAANTYSGPTSSDAGITFEGPNGSARNSLSFTVSGLGLDNSDGVNNDRINDAATITLRGGGFGLAGHLTESVTEVVGDVVLARGRNYLSAHRYADSASETLLHMRSLTRQNRAVASVSGAGRIVLSTPPALVGTGAVGTPGVGTVPYLFGDGYEAIPATYDPGSDGIPGNADDVGLRGLRSTELATLADAADGDNVRIDGEMPGPIAAKAINSLSIGDTDGAGPITGTGTLGIRSGLIIVNRARSYGTAVLSGFDAVDFGEAEGIIHNAVGGGLTPSFEIASPVRGSGGLTKSGYGGVRLSGTHDYTGTVTILEERLDVDHPTGLGSGGDGVILDGGELGIVASFTTDRRIATGSEGGGIRVDHGVTLTLTSPIVAINGPFSARGAGTLVLAAPSESAQRNVFVGGTLVLANATGSATGDSMVFVQYRSTLAGSGAASGRVTVYAGGRVAPGTSDDPVATLTLGDLVMRDGSSLRFDLAGPQHSDHLRVNGDLTLDGNLFVTALDGFGLGTYRLIDYAGSLTDDGVSVRGPSEYLYQIDAATPGQVNLIVLIPEPGCLAAVGVLLPLLRRRR